MSIIYDALKKTQGDVSPQTTPPAPDKTARDNKESAPGASKNKFKLGPFFVLVLIILIIAGFVWFMPVLKNFAKDKNVIQLAFSKLQGKSKKKANTIPSKKPLTIIEKIIPASLANLIKSNSAVAESRFPSLTLQGIFASEGDSWVIMNDQVLKKGDKINDAQILDILPHEVKLIFQGEGFSLILK